MLVGHLPFLARLAGLLAAGDPDRPIVEIETAGLVALRLDEGRWTVTCVMQPVLLPLLDVEHG